MVHYVALIQQSACREFTVSFPDLPGCMAAGPTAETAMRCGTEALACHVEQRLADGQDVPSPRDLDQIRLDTAGSAPPFPTTSPPCWCRCHRPRAASYG